MSSFPDGVYGKILEGELSVKEIYDEAERQSIEITAAGYNLLFLYLQEKNKDKMAGFLRKQDEVLHYFLRYPQYLLFRWNVNSYGVRGKGGICPGFRSWQIIAWSM